MALFVLWPAILWVLSFAISVLARSAGCTIWARGPEPCVAFGVDFGGFLYSLWALGFMGIYVVVWIFFAILVVGLVRLMARVY